MISGLQGINPGGTITWTLYSNSNCTSQVTTLGPVTVNGNGTYEPTSGTTIFVAIQAP